MERKTFKIKKKDMLQFQQYLQERENSTATIEKYMRDMKKFQEFASEGGEIGKEKLLQYKEWLMAHYSVNSANSMLAALNQFLVFIGMGRLRIKRIRTQKTNIHNDKKELTKKEFQLLVRTAYSEGKEQLGMIMETMSATGIRVSELKFFRAEHIRSGMIKVWNKGKYRIVLIPTVLRKKLLIYMNKHQIKSGLIFRTRTGKELNRSNIWKDMKRIAQKAGIALEKVFPHNLRHLFARTFYKETNNLLNLADILGHSSLEVTRIYASNGLEEWKRNLEKVKLLEVTT